MSFTFTDPDGDTLDVTPTRRHGRPAINIRTTRTDIEGAAVAVDIPLAQLEEVIAGMRDIARQAAKPAGTV